MKVGDLVKLRDYIELRDGHGIVLEVKEGRTEPHWGDSNLHIPSLVRVHWVQQKGKDYDSWASSDDLIVIKK